jgi:hypothetical protein
MGVHLAKQHKSGDVLEEPGIWTSPFVGATPRSLVRVQFGRRP